MKKSNKLLLAGFLTGLLLITSLHITLYAKYKAGHYTIYDPEDDLAPGTLQMFPNILFVSVRNVPDASVSFGEAARIEKDEEDGLSYVQKNDTLLITGSDSSQEGGMRSRAVFTLPYNATLSVFNSSISFRPGKKASENNPVIYLQRSQAFFSSQGSLLQFGNMKLVAYGNSTVDFRGRIQVGHLDLQLSNSIFDDAEGNFGQLSIATDSLSHISLQAKHLTKANIKTIASQ